LVDPPNEVVCIENLSGDDQGLPVDAVGLVGARAGLGRTGVVDGGEGGLVPVLERGRIDGCLVDLVKEELVRVGIERLGIGPALANRWVLIWEFLVNVNDRIRLEVAGGE
jgi:hypothetical protein